MATYKTIKYIVPVEVVEHTDSINALADVDTSTATPTEGQTIKWDGTNWVPGDIEESSSATQKVIFSFGYRSFGQGGYTNVTNLVSSSGVMASDTTGVGTARSSLAAAGYGGDKAIFGFGFTGSPGRSNITNLVSNVGVVATDTTGVGTVRGSLAAAGYGGDKALFGFGNDAPASGTGVTNLVSNAGVVSSDVTGVGTGRYSLAAAGYGGDKAIFGFGYDSNGATNVTNLVSNTGVVASDTTGVGTARYDLAAAGFGGDKAIFGFGDDNTGNDPISTTNLVSNAGVVASNTTNASGVEARTSLAAAGYGGDKAIFGFGYSANQYLGYGQQYINYTNLVSNTGVVANINSGIGTGRSLPAAAGFSTTA